MGTKDTGKLKAVEIVRIPEMDTSFMDNIMNGGIADSGFEAHGDVYYSYDANAANENCEERLKHFGFDVEKIKQWRI
ncbi:hypothetical protein CQA49_08920 [Helicobacter sp. MIT 00-7814]|uniref:hypothetical protein n=1 Tax=unclassified Helicobacter TaxID=2593540 RepID=UPI000E1F6054|nr:MULTISPECIES: hypothetical protein [unclassified Helicobacter]RDU51950.1 hypothetical protein CQA49_08920 [Helicobacter sp. MIT 00-7814]RDU54120.1 hypothetical protein CQA37_05775 [Helicobacter sp. MIT 99-10781]